MCVPGVPEYDVTAHPRVGNLKRVSMPCRGVVPLARACKCEPVARVVGVECVVASLGRRGMSACRGMALWLCA